MKRFYLIITLITVSCLSAYSQDRSCDSWSADRKLNWSEFKAKPNKNLASWANTACAIGYSFEGNNDSAFFKVECCFESELSWVKENPTDLLLRHEQAHFDLAEVYARELRKKLSTTHLVFTEASRHVPLIYKGIMKEYNDEQKRYDKETDHSREEVQQKSWEKQISSRLRSLEMYADQNVRRKWNK